MPSARSSTKAVSLDPAACRTPTEPRRRRRLGGPPAVAMATAPAAAATWTGGEGALNVASTHATINDPTFMHIKLALHFIMTMHTHLQTSQTYTACRSM